MRKFVGAFIAVVFALSLISGCAPESTAVPDDGKIKIVSTIFPPYDFARQIAGDRADITMLLPPASESHSYEPTPQDIIEIQACDVFIYVGGESDTWVSGILDAIDTSSMTIVTLMDCVEALAEEYIEGMEVNEQENDGEVEYDEHVWTSPSNAILITQKIADALCTSDPNNSDYYNENCSNYVAELNQLDAKFSEIVAGAKRTTVVFADRFPLRYFTEAYGLSYFAAFPGCTSEIEPSAATVAFLIDKVSDENIPVVFYIELSNQKMADTICEETGCKKLLFHSCHNVSKEDFESGTTYLDLMYNNADVLKEALY